MVIFSYLDAKEGMQFRTLSKVFDSAIKTGIDYLLSQKIARKDVAHVGCSQYAVKTGIDEKVIKAARDVRGPYKKRRRAQKAPEPGYF